MIATTQTEHRKHQPRDDWKQPSSAPSASGSDEELLARYRDAGDRPAFNNLVHRYERELCSYLRRYLGDAQAAEDVFQGTFLQVHLKRDQFEQGKKFRPWLYAVATNQAIDSQRRNRRHRAASLDRVMPNEVGDDGASFAGLLAGRDEQPHAALDAKERSGWVRRAVDELPESMRAVVALVYFQGLKYRDAAGILGVPVGTVKSRMHAAVGRLGAAWRNDHGPARRRIAGRGVGDAHVAN